MSEIQAWRFLVSRNQFLDYRTVVAPDFMCQANIASLLAKTAEGDPTNDDFAYYREIHGSKSGDLTIIYRVSEAQAKDLNSETQGVIKDSFGREIYFIEGVVVKGIQTSLSITIENLEFTHQQLVDDYREFWEWVSPQSAIPSEATILELKGNPLQYRQVPEYVISPLPLKSEKLTQTDLFKPAQSCQFHFDGEIRFSKFIDASRLLVHQYNEYAKHNNAVIILNWETGEKRVLIQGNLNRYIRKVVLNADSNLVCTANVISPDRNILRILDFNNSIESDVKENNPSEFGRVNALAFSHDGSVVATDEKNSLCSSVPIKLVDTKSGGIRGKELSWHKRDVKCIESSPLDNIFFCEW